MSTDREVFMPGKLWSLWELINFQVGPLVSLLRTLFEESYLLDEKMRYRDLAASIDRMPPALPGQPPKAELPERLYKVTDIDLTRVDGVLNFAEHIIKDMLLTGSENRLARFRMFLADKPVPGRIKLELLKAEIDTLRDAIQDDCRYKRLHLYRDDKSLVLMRVPGDWAPSYTAFPSTQKDVTAATDCYALEHYTACVFHLMRAAEIGLRAIAKERKVVLPKGKPLEWANWGEIYDAIEKAKTEIAKTKPAGNGKDQALGFYSGALGHLSAFKDQYRNIASHVRKDFEEWEAQIALNHVRDFMNGLPPLITEANSRPIKWKF